MRPALTRVLLGDEVILFSVAIIGLILLYGLAFHHFHAIVPFLVIGALMFAGLLVTRAFLRPKMRVGATIVALVTVVDAGVIALAAAGLIEAKAAFWLWIALVLITSGSFGAVIIRDDLDF